jgi:predicted RNA binding protein YcfA (HicA-like mRNA interferase family)
VAPRLPQASGDAVVALLGKLGYRIVRQRGNHIQMKRMTESGERCLTVPAHKSIAKGTLNDIMTKVSLSTGLPRQDLLSRLWPPGRRDKTGQSRFQAVLLRSHAGRVFRDEG